ncbi:M56 family peptidase [Bacteroides xylanisolvens]|uniref:TonB-dependent receptor plug domain-containing protein n=1 Tax=Bacteroides xylanisolvens TaxID=371601 RepID=A0AAW4T0Y1_9BACE|nr:M56 family metallopeptidase [Bacteroides xylanisolvens]MCA4534632.1 TonB-dependent receptor plug domain-containing protein [Bacteroides xylanisolvens]MCA4552684.1 TonB-dependent receptor plug domain-containing protein [Bacteroides xylanisolvens]MCA4566242.1 TonB-dependent receptor plug domain-containing protein [Bacteroides xylanisolvens]MCA4571174.1 TonB-dependent receptor plug domain-containing protein [Bacteroides xylanisolvens]MCA4601681.1 TonB-dependent receptor plug domain-containing 
MGVFFIYILKSSVCLVLFYLFFRLLLSKETFHRFNRMALLGVLFFSLLIPCIEVTTRHQVEVQQAVLSIEQLLLMAELETTPANVGAVQETSVISWVQIVLLVYWAGILFLACRNIYSLICLFRLVHSGKHEKLEKGVTLVVHNQEIAPFSWMKYIVISRKDLEENGREILIHEMAHIHHRHSVDLLVADICIFFQWFNPGAWLLKQELQNVHEYEADETVINEGVNAKEYQLLLIKKAVGTRLYSMANSFNHSKLKKRITMMLKEKSNPWARLKYLYVLPLAAIAVTAFARPEISEKMEEISAVKVNDLAEIVEKKSEENVVKELVDTTKNKVVVVGYRTEKKDSVLTSGKKKVAISVQGISGEGKPLVIINGKESDREVVNALNPERIESVSVIGPEKAIKIYGEKAKDGVMDIKLYSEKKFAPRKIEIEGINKTRLDALNSGAKSWGATFRSADGGKPLVIIDGKEATGDDPLANISPDRIRSISVLKDKTALAAYGDKGKNGVVEVNLLVKEEYQARQISIRAINDTVTSTIKVTASEE